MRDEYKKSLTRIVSNEEISMIDDEVDRLFMLQDRPITEKKRKFIVSEISNTGFPLEAILKGLRNLTDIDVKNLKFSVIKKSITEQMEPINVQGCDKCSGGFISMLDEKRRRFTFACTCTAGKTKYAVGDIEQWNGQKFQMYKGERMVLDE